jgi:putative redox protein
MEPNITTLRLCEGLHFTGRTARGHELELDGEAATGPSPMELQLLALGGCGAMDTISILRKMRQDVTGYELLLTHERAGEHPRVFTSITMTHAVRGRALAEGMIRRAISLTMARYCPVYAMLQPTVDIRERYEITDDATGATISAEITSDDVQAAAKP